MASCGTCKHWLWRQCQLPAEPTGVRQGPMLAPMGVWAAGRNVYFCDVCGHNVLLGDPESHRPVCQERASQWRIPFAPPGDYDGCPQWERS